MITYETTNTPLERAAVTYETKNTHPGTLPSATIYLDGLLCLCFDHANKCTIGVNNVAGSAHTWKFSIVDHESNTIMACNQSDFPDLHEIHIDVKGGVTGGTFVYNGQHTVEIPTSGEHRFNLESSWIDLEGPRGHNKPVKNDAKTLWPRFYINEGLFCASKLSVASFDLKDNNLRPLIKPLGKIALQVVADIFLDRDRQSKIEVKLPGDTVSLDNTKRYQIYITNDCGSDSLAPVHTDFHLHYNAFSGAFGHKAGDQFRLVNHNLSKTDSAVAQTGDPDYFTDKAPCMNIALGQTSAFKA